MPLKPHHQKRFWNKVDFSGECWLWLAAVLKGWYGQFRVDGKCRQAHRLAWEEFYGPIPSGSLVCHSCDNPRCVNPSHLFLGSIQDNSDDKMRKGRDNPPVGERARNAKLISSDVISIRARFFAGEHWSEICKDFPVQKETVRQICRRQIWKHI